MTRRRYLATFGMLTVLAIGAARAAEYYVTPTGAGSANGSNWANAFSSLQDAVDASTLDGDSIYLKYGSYSNAAQVEIADHPGLFIKGGYEGTGTPPGGGPLSGSDTILTRAGSVTNRILYATNSVITLDNLIVKSGRMAEASAKGINLMFEDCASVTVSNCVVRDGYLADYFVVKGGGIYFGATGGTLTVIDSLVADNEFYSAGHGANSTEFNLGAGLYFEGDTLVLDGTDFTGNRMTKDYGAYGSRGAGIYVNATSAATITNCLFEANRFDSQGDGTGRRAYGGAIYLDGAGTVTLVSTRFYANYIDAMSWATSRGAAISAVSSGTLSVASCVFSNNYVISGDGFVGAVGGAIDRQEGAGPIEITDCVFDGNYVISSSSIKGDAIYLSGGSVTGMISRCRFDGSAVPTEQNGSPRTGQMIAVLDSASLIIRDTEITRSAGTGIHAGGTALIASNCLSAASTLGDGILLATGTVSLVNCTLADNVGWGLQRTAGSGTVTNTIAWGNAAGGITSNENLTVGYSCVQATVHGNDNLVGSDPLFMGGDRIDPPTYYLSAADRPAPQGTDSPARGAGSGNSADYGLDTRTTRTDGQTNAYPEVDMGYYYADGMADESVLDELLVFSTNIFVDAINGTNSNTGLAIDQPLQTLTLALSRILDNGVIHVATGTYSTASNDEGFPLVVSRSNLRIIGANREHTVVNGGGTTQVFKAVNRTPLHLSGLTFRNGRLYNNYDKGAVLYLDGCADVTISNCVVRDAYATRGSSDLLYVRGGGIYYSAEGGTLSLIDSLVADNVFYDFGHGPAGTPPEGMGQGAGLYYEGGSLVLRNTEFRGNRMTSSYGAYTPRGAGLFAKASSVTVTNCLFNSNRFDSGGASAGRSARGAAIFLGGSGHAEIFATTFVSNFIYGIYAGPSMGGAVMATNQGTLNLDGCVFSNNYVNSNSGTVTGMGGALARNGGLLVIENSAFDDNFVLSSSSVKGGALYVGGAAATARVAHCTFDSRAVATNRGETVAASDSASLLLTETDIRYGSEEGIVFDGEWFAATNLLVAGCTNGGIRVTAGTVDLVNATLAGNDGWGISNAAGTVTLRNSIIWGNTAGSISGTATVTYSDIEGGHAGTENISTNPLFADAAAGDYHLQSRAGRWSAALSDWVLTDAENSPCIDAGDDDPRWQLETEYNGRIINLGRYGGTAQASRTFVVKGSVLIVR